MPSEAKDSQPPLHEIYPTGPEHKRILTIIQGLAVLKEGVGSNRLSDLLEAMKRYGPTLEIVDDTFLETQTNRTPPLAWGGYRLRTGLIEIPPSDVRIHLTPTEEGLMRSLMLAQGDVVSRKKLLESAVINSGATRTVNTHISRLRLKLDPRDPLRYIRTSSPTGYYLHTREVRPS